MTIPDAPMAPGAPDAPMAPGAPDAPFAPSAPSDPTTTKTTAASKFKFGAAAEVAFDQGDHAAALADAIAKKAAAKPAKSIDQILAEKKGIVNTGGKIVVPPIKPKQASKWDPKPHVPPPPMPKEEKATVAPAPIIEVVQPLTPPPVATSPAPVEKGLDNKTFELLTQALSKSIAERPAAPADNSKKTDWIGIALIVLGCAILAGVALVASYLLFSLIGLGVCAGAIGIAALTGGIIMRKKELAAAAALAQQQTKAAGAA